MNSPLLSCVARCAALIGLLLTIGFGPAAAQQKVGISGAVNPDVRGTPPGAAARQLVIGQDVVFNERITSAAEGQTQIVFLDESTMTVGPNSDLVIDQFVYDPRSGTGRLAMSATRGLLRYVGGKLSKQDGAVTLRTSTATLAVRGGAFIANLRPNGSLDVIFLYGAGLTVSSLPAVQRAAISQTITRPGFEISVGPDGQMSPPHPVPPGLLAQLLQQLDGRPNGTGGLAVVPTGANVVNSGIGQVISGNISDSIIQSIQNSAAGGLTTVTTAAQSFGGPNPNLTLTLNNIDSQFSTVPSQVIDCVTTGACNPANTVTVATTAGGQPIGGSGSISPTPPPPTSTNFSGRLKNTNGRGTTFGFVDQSANGDIPYAGGQLVNGVFTGTFGNLGTISFPLPPGSATFATQTSSTGLLFSGTTFLSADNTFFYATLIPTGQPNERLFVFGGTPVNPAFYQPTGSTRIFAFTVQPDAALQSNIPFMRSQAGGNLGGATVSPLFIAAPPTTAIGDTSTAAAARGMQASLAVSGQAANQQSAIAVTAGTLATLQGSGQPIFNGQLRGSSLLSAGGTPVALRSAANSTVDGAGNSLYGGNSISGFVVDQTAYASGANGTVGSAIVPSTATEVPLSGGVTNYGFAQAAVPTPAVVASRTTQALTGNFGGLMYTTAQTNPYIVTGGTLISTEATTNRIQATLAGSPQSPSSGVSALTMQFGGLSGPAGAQAFIDDRTFAAAESTTNPQQITINNTPSQPQGQLYLVSSGAAGQPAAILPSGVSYCQCQFLQWGYWGGDLDSGSASFPRIDRGHINTWVAGVPTSVGDLNSLIGTSAVATYSGHSIGSVFNNGQSYLAAGGFSGTYNFGTQTGTLAITNFDGHSFAGSGRAPLTGANYSFGITTPGARGVINGTFYGPMAAETGGNFAVQTTVGPTYLASGIFAGKR